VRTVHVVVPDGIDDPARPSGGNKYDRNICRLLGSLDCLVHEHAIPGPWPRPDRDALGSLAGVMGRIPDGALALVDGLVASPAPDVLVAEAHRLRLVVLVHMPLGHRPAPETVTAVRTRECAVLEAAAAVVTTSHWSARRLLELYRLVPERVHVAEPGVDRADLAPGSPQGSELLCVANVTLDKGHDVLVEALLLISRQSWRCVCVGRLDRDPEFVAQLQRRTLTGGVEDRVLFPGPRTGPDLDRSYLAADLMVLASRGETYGMVVTEALSHGLPVVATEVGGLSEALGHGEDGLRPGLLVPPDDPVALAAALRSWLDDAELRGRLRRAAHERRGSLCGWSVTAATFADILTATAR
jgi:glycosyltransferase involved in cell wall biosynthesis